MRLFLVLTFFVCLFGYGQDQLPFQEEVEALQKKYDTLWDSSKETVVFAGSSSIRFWENLPEVFPEYQIVNSGFGGSQASDLLGFTEELILRYNPKKVFIYEGDNDIFARKRPKRILADTEAIISEIREKDPSTQIVLIAAKPSLARWHLKRGYKKLNRKFRKLSEKHSYLEFADVWEIMLKGRKVRDDIFIEDGLHMNARGYELWYQVIRNYIN
ncbi:MAG: GDSL-type esterase/lipase family protein [Bacteroidota bacterium]